MLAVRARPRGGRDAIERAAVDADGRCWLSVRLAAAPSDGAANAALVALVAKTLGIRRSDVTLAAGATARLKRLHVRGDATALGAAIDALIRGLE
nr:DUF167 family protein [Sphingomonas montanisoli]